MTRSRAERRQLPVARHRRLRLSRHEAPGAIPAALYVELLDGDRRAGRLELGLGVLGGVLGDLLQQRLGSAVDQILGLLEAQAGDDLADDLDDADLLLAGALEDDVELGLLLGGLGGGASGGGRRRRRPERRR